MIKRIFKFLGLLIVAFFAIGVVMYLFGARLYMTGGGGFTVGFVGSSASHERAVEEHRQQQRAAAPPSTVAQPVTTPDPAAAPVAPGSGSATASTDWTDFRGPNRDGIYRGKLLDKWPDAGLTPLWKQPVGEGYASFVVSGGRAFTIEQRGGREVVAAYDVATGREIWTNAWTTRFSEIMGGDGPRATPTVADGIVYALGAEGQFRALDAASGKALWSKNILEEAKASNLQWGMSSAPLIVDDTVVVAPGGSAGKSVIAYNRRTGAEAWSALDDAAGYASPVLVTLAGVRQILVFTSTRLVGISPDGKLLWEHQWRTQADINAAQPLVVADNRVFLSSGYGVGGAVIELTRQGDTFAVREVWRNVRMKNRFNSSVLYQGHIYGFDESILACVDAATGDLKWKGGRYGYGQILLNDDRIIVLTEGGELILVRATPQGHEELGRSPAISGKTWNHPAITNGILLVRNLREMAAFDLRPR
jgi:outer membrane protein assembly factor BamB